MIVRWAKRTYKRLRGHKHQVFAWLARVKRRFPALFPHWCGRGGGAWSEQWEPGELRGSRPVLRAAMGQFPWSTHLLNPWDIDALQEIAAESGHRVFNILQLRLHPSIIALKESIAAAGLRMHDVDLSISATSPRVASRNSEFRPITYTVAETSEGVGLPRPFRESGYPAVLVIRARDSYCRCGLPSGGA